MTCSVPTCDYPIKSRGYCQAHYMRLWSTGSVQAEKPVRRRIMGDDYARFWAKVEKTETCWLWTAAVGKGERDGYGRFRAGSKTWLAHRWAWIKENGSIPEGLQVDHLCRVHACVRSSHLEPVTPKVNVLRGESLNAQNARKIRCKHGHSLNGSNLYVPSRGGRQCRACRKRNRRAYRQRTGK